MIEFTPSQNNPGDGADGVAADSFTLVCYSYRSCKGNESAESARQGLHVTL